MHAYYEHCCSAPCNNSDKKEQKEATELKMHN